MQCELEVYLELALNLLHRKCFEPQSELVHEWWKVTDFLTVFRSDMDPKKFNYIRVTQVALLQ